MTKKDTIILAVLLNIVVLAGVLVTARQVLPKTEVKTKGFVPYTIEEQKKFDSSTKDEEVAFDEIDQLLEEYGSKDSSSVNPVSPPPPPPEEKKERKEKQKKQESKDCFYVVRPGDNPWKIAKKFHLSFEKFLELNNLDETKAKNLKVGQTLRIRE